MSELFAIAAGGATGAVLRFWASTAVYGALGRDFPYGTLVVNVAGSLAMGFLYFWLLERSMAQPALRGFVLIGLLGAFTTFSTFSIETLNLIEAGQWAKAMVNAVSSVVLCVAAAALGLMVGRQL
jgi:CrcB protein